jgi:hypothetical protein
LKTGLGSASSKGLPSKRLAIDGGKAVLPEDHDIGLAGA